MTDSRLLLAWPDQPHVRAAQQYQALTVYTFHCRSCDASLEGEFGPLWFSGEYPVEDTDALDNAAWLEMDDSWHCPRCVHRCWETFDERVIRGSFSACPDCNPANDESGVAV